VQIDVSREYGTEREHRGKPLLIQLMPLDKQLRCVMSGKLAGI
jgi:hypothetical protein